jgi:hypothetical protein
MKCELNQCINLGFKSMLKMIEADNRENNTIIGNQLHAAIYVRTVYWITRY